MSALQRQTEESGSESVNAIVNVGDAKFFIDDAAFFVLQMKAIESRGEALFFGGVRQEIAGKLPRDELVEGKILVEGFDDPIAIRPHRTRRIHLIAVSVGVARE